MKQNPGGFDVGEIKRFTLRATPNSSVVRSNTSSNLNSNHSGENKSPTLNSSKFNSLSLKTPPSPILPSKSPQPTNLSSSQQKSASTSNLNVGNKNSRPITPPKPSIINPDPTEEKPKPTTLPIVPPSDKKLTEEEYRQKIIQEILDTEVAYTKHLTIMIDKYMKPLKEDPKFSKEPVSEIFSNVEDIYQINSVILASLKERIEGGKENVQLGDIFLLEGAHLKPHYIKYTQLYQNAQNALSTCEKSASFNSWTSQALEGAGETIRSLQIKPIQRITRYVLLLNDLIKHTPSSHPDHSNLQSSLEKMTITAKVVNEAIKEGENRQKILDIQSSFLGKMQLLEAHRIFVREGILSKVCRKSTKQRWFFLFNDILIHASLTSINKYTSHQIWKLSDIRVEDMVNKDSSGCAFQFITTSKSFVVYAANKTEKYEWLKDISETADEYAKKRATFSKGQNSTLDDERIEAPVWQQDSEARNCSLCNGVFSFFNRRHHCRACGRCVCDACSSKRLQLKNMGSTPVRVCDECHFENTHQSLA